jgi:chemotaxis protein methyltransferase CheR
LGTDISRDALNLAHQATYRDWSLRGKGKEFAAPYLEEVGGSYRVNSKIRRSVHFEYLNLALGSYPSTATGTRGVDLILCRNVMIYFDQETIQSIVHRFHRCLAPGGWLVTAASDPPIHEYDLFEIVSTKHGMVFRKGKTAGRTTAAETRISAFTAAVSTSSPTKDEPTEQFSCVIASTGSFSQASSATDNAARLEEAKAAMESGEYEQAAAIAAQLSQLDEAASVHVKALANRDVFRAEQACEAATKKQPLSEELHYLHAILLIDMNRHADAAEALQRVLYLDRTLALAHYSLGTVFRTLGNLLDARREFRLAEEICVVCQPSDLVPLGEDQCVGDLLEMIQLQLEAVEKAIGVEHET